MKKLHCTLAFIFLLSICFSQTSDSTYAERLGYPKGSKVVILHVDDAGMSFDSNEGTILALTKGAANSCSVMMPCGWVPGFVHFFKKNPGIDAGLHLTLTSEWREYRWVPLAGKPSVPGLVDEEGAMWRSVEDVVKNATADEVEKEIRAQFERAKTMGFQPTHFDSHMGTLFATPAFLERYVKLGIENNIPVMLPAGHATLIADQSKLPPEQIAGIREIGKALWTAGLPVLDDLHNYTYGWEPPKDAKTSPANAANYKTKQYIEALRLLKPGLTMMIMHCTAPTEVFPHISDSGPSRKADLDAMTDPAFKKALQNEKIILTTWRELKERRDNL